MPYQFIDMEYHSSIEILRYFAVNFLSCCHGQVQSIPSKALQLTKLLLTCQRYLLQDKHMWPSAELLHSKDYKSLTTTVLQSKKTRESILKCYDFNKRNITFVSPIIPTLPEQEFIKISHLNVRGYLDHINDLKADHVISSADIICLTETHLCKSDTVHPNSQPIKSHVQYRVDRVGGVQKGGILIFVNQQIPSTRLNIQIPGLEFLATSFSPSPNTKNCANYIVQTIKYSIYSRVHSNGQTIAL